jgi:hypothetical protein
MLDIKNDLCYYKDRKKKVNEYRLREHPLHIGVLTWAIYDLHLLLIFMPKCRV